jgi:hypothetical protein
MEIILCVIGVIYLSLVANALTSHIKGCGGNCKQGRLPCNCKKNNVEINQQKVN